MPQKTGNDYPFASWRLLAWLRTVPVENATQFAVLTALIAHASFRDGSCRLRISTICTTAKLSRRIVFKTLNELEAMGLIIKERQFLGGQQRPSLYRFTEFVKLALQGFGPVPGGSKEKPASDLGRGVHVVHPHGVHVVHPINK